MKILFVILSILLCVIPVEASKMFWATCLTGGTTGCLDAIDGGSVTAADGAIVLLDTGSTTPKITFYRAYESGTAESSPDVIAPDSSAGNKRWHLVTLQSIIGTSITSGVIDLARLPALTENYVWLGDGSNRPAASATIATDTLPALTENYVWTGNSSSRPVAGYPSASYLTGTLDSVDRLPALTENYIWLGNGSTRPAASATLVTANLPALSENYVWVGDATSRPAASTTLNTSLITYSSPTSDHSAHGIAGTWNVDSGATVAAGQCMHVDTDGELVVADADASTTVPCVCLLIDASVGSSKKCLTHGVFRDDSWAWSAAGVPIYLSSDPTTTSGLTETNPATATDAFPRKVGIALSGDVILFGPQHEAQKYTSERFYVSTSVVIDGADGPAASTTLTSGTNKVFCKEYATTGDEDSIIVFGVPYGADPAQMAFRVVGFVSNATAPANTETIIFKGACASIGNSDSLGASLGTEATSTFTADATYAQYDRIATPWADIVPANAASGETLVCKFYREADDTYAQVFCVDYIEIRWGIK